ncbi:MAG: hypothetical protein ACKOV8_05040 [Phycisphaerales bacterium]
MKTWPAVVTAIIGAAMALAACSAPRTWPSASGSQGISADAPPLPQVVIAAVKHAHQEIAPGTPLVYNLPQEINLAAFGTYERGLAPGKPMCPADKDVWTVRQARIDGGKAQVDIEYPARDGIYQTVTVHMKGASAGFGYKPDYLQFWKVPVKAPVCQTPVRIVEKSCGAEAAAALKATRDAAAAAAAPAPAPAAAATPPAATPVSSEEPSK